MDQTPLKRPQFFFTTAPLPCPYLPDRLERKLVTELSGPGAESLHEALARSGFRRSHSIAYAPACPGCKACVPVRVVVPEFSRQRSMARLWKQNQDLMAIKVPARATTEQYELFARYQQSRHAGSDMALMGFYEYSAMVEDSPIDTFMVEFRDRSGALVAVCLTDRTSDGLSAVYSFFETEASPGGGSPPPSDESRAFTAPDGGRPSSFKSRAFTAPDGGRPSSFKSRAFTARAGLGNYVVLWLIDQCQRMNLPYVYLGYWIADSAKMAYKARFQPLECLGPEGWTRLVV